MKDKFSDNNLVITKSSINVFPRDISSKDWNLWRFPYSFLFLNLIQYAFIIFAAVCASLYFLFLCVMIFRVFWNIRGKRAAIPTMSRARQLQYQVRETLLWERDLTRVTEGRRELSGVRWRRLTRVDVGSQEFAWVVEVDEKWGWTRIDDGWRELSRVDGGWQELTRVDESWRELRRIDESWRRGLTSVYHWQGLTKVDLGWREFTRFSGSCQRWTRNVEDWRKLTRVDGRWQDFTMVDQSLRDLTRSEFTRVDEGWREISWTDERRRGLNRVHESWNLIWQNGTPDDCWTNWFYDSRSCCSDFPFVIFLPMIEGCVLSFVTGLDLPFWIPDGGHRPVRWAHCGVLYHKQCERGSVEIWRWGIDCGDFK